MSNSDDIGSDRAGTRMDEGASSNSGDRGLVVIISRHAGRCSECNREFFSGDIIRIESPKQLCLECADLSHLVFLPRGDTALTRRATKHSPLTAVVVQWARARKRYERQGILVAADALARAETECLGDADARARQRERAATTRESADAAYLQELRLEVQRLFPGCPAEEAARIAAWTGQKYSGRVGRSAAAKAMDPHALRLAVIAHIRHEHTNYDRLLGATGDRQGAREQVRATIDGVLAQWERVGGGKG